MGVNVTVIDLRAGGEPKVFKGQEGGTVAEISGAHNQRTTDRAGDQAEHTDWHRVKAFGPAARFLERYVHTGSHLLVTGELHNRTYEKDGQKRAVTEIHVVPGRGSIELLDPRTAIGERPTNGNGQEPAA